jgi:4-amino-4-deoxy-L-arabinose transferase-like glycosyltransferase
MQQPQAPPAAVRPTSGTPARRDDTGIYLMLGAIVLAYLLLGLAWVFYANNIPWADADFYFRGARFIAEGQGYSHPFKAGNPPTAFHPVGYPWLLAQTWTVLRLDTGGCDPGTWPALDGCDSLIQAGQVLNVLLGSINIVLVFILASQLKGPQNGSKIGLLSAAIFAVIPSRLLFSSALMSEETFTTLVLLALIALVLSVRRPRWLLWTAIGFGLAVGAATFVRPLAIVLLPLPLLLLWGHVLNLRQILQFLAVAAVLVVAMILPWELRNNRELGGPAMIISNNGGINLWIGCHLDANGDLEANGEWMDWWSGDAPASLNTQDELANDNEAQRLALECMRKQPVAFALREDFTYVGKWSLNHDLPEQPVDPIVSGEVTDAFMYLLNSVYFVLLPLAAIGAIGSLFAPSAHRGLLGASFLMLALIPIFFFGDPRFHMPLFPIMSIWAADGILVVLQGLRSARGQPYRPQTAEPAPKWGEQTWPR